MKKNIWLNNKLNTEALFSFKDAKREVNREIRNSRAKYYHNEFNIKNIIAGTPGILYITSSKAI